MHHVISVLQWLVDHWQDLGTLLALILALLNSYKAKALKATVHSLHKLK